MPKTSSQGTLKLAEGKTKGYNRRSCLVTKRGKNVKRSVVNSPVGCCGLLENMSCRVRQTDEAQSRLPGPLTVRSSALHLTFQSLFAEL